MWQAEQTGKCPGCGHRLEDTTDESQKHRWNVKIPRCFACQKAARRVKGDGKRDFDGLLQMVVDTKEG